MLKYLGVFRREARHIVVVGVNLTVDLCLRWIGSVMSEMWKVKGVSK